MRPHECVDAPKIAAHLPVNAICKRKALGVQMDTNVAPSRYGAVCFQTAGHLVLVGGWAPQCPQPGLSDGQDALGIGRRQAAWGEGMHRAVVEGTKLKQAQDEISRKGKVLCEERRQQAGLGR